jgi:predicted nucleotidyltransferase
MTILPVEQNVGQGFKVISQGRMLKKKETKKLDYPVYKKFLQVFLKNLEAGLKENLLAVVLYGSVARGSAGPESDIDLLILYRKGEIDVDKVYVDSALLADKSPVYQRLYKKGLYGQISPMLMTLEEIRKNPLILLDIMEEGIILYQRGNCFNELVERMRAVTKELGTRRVNLKDGSWYWELKLSWKPGELIEVVL